MPKLNFVLDTPLITTNEFRLLVAAMKRYVPMVCSAWGKPVPGIQYSNRRYDGMWNVLVTDQNRQSGAYGYHTVENGYPTAYVSPTACGVTTGYGRETAIFGAYMPKSTYLPKGFLLPGLAAVLAHEVAEMLVDPMIDTWFQDADKNYWLCEVGDQANSTHFPLAITARIGLRNVTREIVFADFALPSFYTPNGVFPYTMTGKGPQKPFDHIPGNYAYIRDITGARLTQFARPSDLT